MARFSITDFLASRKVAACLFIVFILMVIVGANIPQEHFAGADHFAQWRHDNVFFAVIAIKLGLTRVYSGFPFIAIFVLLLLSTLFCTYRRVLLFAGTGEISGRSLPPGNVVSIEFSTENFLEELQEQVTRFLIGNGFRKGNNDHQEDLIFEKGHKGFWGSILLHLSFVFLVCGAVISVWTRHEGVFLLTEGQSFRGRPGEYAFQRPANILPVNAFDFAVTLSRFIPSKDKPKEYAHDQVVITEKNGDQIVRVIRPYHSLTHNGLTFYQKEHGFSPSFILKSADGETVFQSYVAFRTQRIGENFLFEDAFVIPGTSYKVSGRFYPDAVEKAGKLKSRSNTPDNPELSLIVNRRGKEVYRGNVSLHQAVEFDNYTLSFNGLRYWSSFRVVRDYGILVLYFGFFIGITGLLFRLFLNHQVVMVEIKDGPGRFSSVRISGKAEREQAIFSEKMDELVNELQNLERVQ